MRIRTYLLFLVPLFLYNCKEASKNGSEIQITDNTSAYNLVNPFIGTGGHGHTYPGATLPFGMVQLSPDTRLEGWDGCSGYHNTDSVIYGFSHTHLSGTGVGDYGDILLMPTQGKVVFNNGYKSTEEGYSSPFNKSTEHASPGYYEVRLNEFNIDVRLTTTQRVGIHEYVFNKADTSNIIIDLLHRDKTLDYDINIVNKKEIEGFRISEGWASEQHIYFVIQSSEEFNFNEALGRGMPFDVRGYQAPKEQKIALRFINSKKKKIMLKVGISAVSIEGARKNLENEAPHWDFEKYKADAKSVWEETLSKIEVEDNDIDKKTIFYTALYHSMIVPNVFSDVDGKYRGMDRQVHQSDKPIYTVFSLWDTFRATHPLYTIIEQDKTNEFINTFLHQYQDGGALPIWELAGNYTGCMIGYHSVSVVSDAYNKGIRDYDTDLALEAMLHSANQDKLGLSSYKNKGYIAAGNEPESVSKTLEYAYDDWCIAEMANRMGENNIAKKFYNRSQFYKNIFNPEVGFMQSKMNGGWNTSFDPTEVNFNFTEANSWQYSMFVPQDISGLIQLYGGNSAFDKKLDLLFNTPSELSGRHQVDITGLIGQYAHGNEPSHHMAYLYNYIGKPWKTQERVNQILNEQYSSQPDGLSGNEDCGQMSAWYVLSSMGIYSVTPGLDYYAIGKPHFSKVKINLENGNQFIIKANNLSNDDIYIQSATLNGDNFNQSYLYHKDIMKGGELIFEMGRTPNMEWGSSNVPIAAISKKYEITPVPFISAASQTFTDSLAIKVSSVDNESQFFYSINNAAYVSYNGSIVLKENSDIMVYAEKNDVKSFVVNATFKKIKGGRSINLQSDYSNQYAAGGDDALIDFLKGSANFRTGYWQGYYATDFSAIIDLGEEEFIREISVGTLQDIKSWIWFPKNITISYSLNGVDFTKITTIENDFPDNEEGAFLKEFKKMLKSPIKAKFVKIEAESYGVCPSWHLGSGNETWMFLDEITVK